MKISAIVILATVIACGDNLAPATLDATPDASAEPFTWADAEAVWADAWCTYAEGCSPEQFADVFGSQDVCRQRVRDLNCNRSDIDCSLPYPDERRAALAQCHADLLVLVCAPVDAPDSCYVAFE